MLDLVAIERALRGPDGRIIDFEIVHMNAVNIDVAGRPREELVGRRLLEVYPAFEPVMATYVEVVETGRPSVIEDLPYEDTIDGQFVRGFYDVHISKFGDGVLVVSRDVTDRHAEHRVLGQTVAQFEAAQRLASIGVWSLDLATDEVWFSDELRNLFGISADAPLPGREDLVAAFFSAGDQSTIIEAQAQLERMAGPIRFEAEVLRTDGDVRNLVVHGDVVVEDGAPARLWGTAQDVSTLRRTERALDEARARLDEQRSVVEELQSAILPVLPNIDGVRIEAAYFPAAGPGRVGGDWYDAFRSPDGRIGLVVGDVAGHGLAAAATMAQLRNALRLAAFTADSPGSALHLLNRFVLDAASGALATVLYALVDPVERTLTWAHAGHPPALLHNEAGTELLEVTGRPPIGFRHEGEFPNHHRGLGADATLLLYTDGLIERRGEIIDMGLDRLRGALDLDSRMDGICERLHTATGGERSGDDICILALSLEPAVGPTAG
jgi:PAS domain-containing protein